MGRLISPKDRLTRREGVDLSLRSALSRKNGQIVRDFPPGMHGHSGKGKTSNYGLQLREKQKVKRIYGILERQFRNYFEKANSKKGVTGHELLASLERRLDNAVYRSGFAATRRHARQLVSHGGVWVNGKRVNVPSFQIKLNDRIQLHASEPQKKWLADHFDQLRAANPKEWVEPDLNSHTFSVRRMPERSDVEYPIEEQLIVELYSK